MGFFGLGSKGKEYRNQWEQYAPWSFGQAQDWTAQSKQYQNRADPYAQWGYDYYGDVLQQGGLPSPASIRATGAEVMPGVDEARARRWSRWGQTADAAGNIKPASQTMEDVWGNTNTQGDIINANQQQQEALITDLSKQLRAAEAAGNKDVVANIKDQLASLEALYGTEYGRLRKSGENLYGGLITAGTEAYGTVNKQLEALKPGGELQTAQVARSYAPVIRETSERLRRGGIEAGSAQGVAALQRAEIGRARGMDEAAGRSIADYVAQKNAATLGQQALGERLGQAQLGYETGLTTEQVAATAGAKKEAGTQFRSELLRSLAANQGISASEAEAKAGNLDATLKRNIELLADKNKAVLLSRALETEDWTRFKEITDGMNQEELTQLGLQQMQYSAGMDYTQAKLGREDQAMANMLGLTAQDYTRATTAAKIAQAYGKDASEVYKQLYGVEAANAGWGTKFLLGAGLSLLTGGLSGLAGGGKVDFSGGGMSTGASEAMGPLYP